MTSSDIEKAITYYPSSPFYYRRWLVVPNISWGLNLHECDLLALSSSNCAHEIEIKVSKSDLKADLGKKHGHRSEKIKCLWFAVPVELKESCEKFCPERAGIILVSMRPDPDGGLRPIASVFRKAKPSGGRKFGVDERLKMAELGVMRYWSRRSAS